MRQVLGLDINDDFIAAAVVRQRGQERKVVDWARRELGSSEVIAEGLAALLEDVKWAGGPVVCGISLAGVSLRNLSVPFTDRRNINQILPLELEDQLIVPVHHQVIEYIITEADEDSSRILVAAMEKENLSKELEMLRAGGLDPAVLTLRNAALADSYRASAALPRDFMLVDAGIHFITMVIVHNGRIVFMRQLPCPERILTREPFTFTGGRAGIANFGEAMSCLEGLCRDIRHSLGVFRIDTEIEYQPEKILLTGIMSGVAEFSDTFSEALQLEVVTGDLQQAAGVTIEGEGFEAWDAAVMDHSLALALHGSSRKQIFNFRKGEFAPRRRLLTSRTQVAAAAAGAALILAVVLGMLAVDYRSLKNRYDQLGAGMDSMYRETFPEATRIHDALVQMKANVRNIQAPSIATPVFSNQKRALNILADISARIPESVVIHVSRLVIDQDSVQVKGNTDTFNNVNIIQSRLRESPGFAEVNIISAAAEKDTGQIRFELRLRTGGGS